MEFTFGNNKLPTSTLIFNMGTAARCPSRELGLCETINCGIKCYALKAEQQYKNAVPQYRTRQEIAWKEMSAIEIANKFINAIKRKRSPTTAIRFNESGDFWSQDCVSKLNDITKIVQKEYPELRVYGYSARRDLDFKLRGIKFIIKASSGDFGNNGSTCVVDKYETVPSGYIKCPGSCKTCSICSQPTKINVAFLRH